MISIPTIERLNFTSNGHILVAETAIEFQQTSITIKAEISNENHPLRLARLLVLQQAQRVIGYIIEQEQRHAQQDVSLKLVGHLATECTNKSDGFLCQARRDPQQ